MLWSEICSLGIQWKGKLFVCSWHVSTTFSDFNLDPVRELSGGVHVSFYFLFFIFLPFLPWICEDFNEPNLGEAEQSGKTKW